MCGIVGYVGREDAYPILIESLKKLEYRGYDSAGIAVWNKGKIDVARRKGKVDQLRELCGDGLKGSMGLAHTRWATHGTPSERNAHPHRAGDVVVVHNGIVENYIELKEELRSGGHRFLSDTDTEVIPHLVLEQMKKGADFVEAVRLAVGAMSGSYALGIMRETEKTLIAAKKESPLVLGIGDKEFFIASDVPALIGRTNRFIFLEDNDVAVMKDGKLSIINVDGEPVERQIQVINWSGAMAEKGGYKHFMLKEIFEQPRAISDTLIGRIKEERG
jgi:glutamine---fructose-6-phosphate transaminase (isomerizing)